MQIATGIDALPDPGLPSVVTVGMFDGVHVGHQSVVRRTIDVARRADVRAAAVTFDRHPRQTLTPGREPPLITTLQRKLSLIAGLGVDVTVVLAFDEAFSRRSPEWFVDTILVEGLGAKAVVIGSNFTFGHQGAGTVATLQEAGAASGFSAEAVPLVELDGGIVSSSSIRAAVAQGDLAWPRLALGRRFAVDGHVVRGAGRGLGLGFPTANLEVPPKMLLPARGIYAGRALAAGGAHAAAIDVGTNPTFGWELLHVEAHLLDFDGDLAGVEMTLEFWDRLRDELRFDSVDALVEQMAEDVARTRAVVGDPRAGGVAS